MLMLKASHNINRYVCIHMYLYMYTHVHMYRRLGNFSSIETFIGYSLLLLEHISENLQVYNLALVCLILVM